MTHDSLPTRTLRERPDLDQLKRQAKELLEAFRAGEPAAITEVTGCARVWVCQLAQAQGVRGGRHRSTVRRGDATSPLTMATERGYDKIVAIIREEEQRRQQANSGVSAPTDELLEAIRSGNDERALALMESDPALVRARHPMFDWTPVHVAAYTLNPRLVAWLLDHGADVMGPRGSDQMTPLDAAADQSGGARDGRGNRAERFATVAHVLLERGAALTARGGCTREWGLASRETRRRHADQSD